MGYDPTTSWTTIRRSTNWATNTIFTCSSFLLEDFAHSFMLRKLTGFLTISGELGTRTPEAFTPNSFQDCVLDRPDTLLICIGGCNRNNSWRFWRSHRHQACHLRLIFCGGSRTRTYEVKWRGIYSPLQLPLCDTPICTRYGIRTRDLPRERGMS